MVAVRRKWKQHYGDLVVLEVLYRRDVLGYSLGEISRHLDIPKGTVCRMANKVDRAMDGRDGNEPDNGLGNGTMPERWWDTPRIETKGRAA